MISSDQVSKVAKLASLSLDEKDLERYSEQLSAIVDYIDQLNEVDVEGAEPLYNVSLKKSVMREDEIRECLSQDKALNNSSNTKNGFFVTKGVFEDE